MSKSHVPTPDELGQNDIRKGDVRWEGLIAQWHEEREPMNMILFDRTYLVLQDPETQDFYFRPVTDKDMYSSRSFG